MLLARRQYGFLCGGGALSGIITWADTADRRRAGNPPSDPTKTGSVVIKKYCEQEHRASNEEKKILLRLCFVFVFCVYGGAVNQ